MILAAVWLIFADLPGGRYLLAVDHVASQLLLVDSRDRMIRIVERISVTVLIRFGSSCRARWLPGRCVIALVAQADIGQAAKRSVSDEAAGVSALGTLDMPFCPQELALAGDGSRLIVADSFGGKLAVVDTRGRTIEVLSWLAHNIRGLAFTDGRTLVVAPIRS